MKREDRLRHFRKQSCVPLREGGGHSVWRNPANGRKTSVPRHREINDYTARGVCRQLGVADP